MREKLKAIGTNKRHTFTGVFQGAGLKKSFHGRVNAFYLPTILFSAVACEGRVVAEHLWCNYTQQFSDIGELTIGDVVSFDARVTEYTKGYVNDAQKIDYGIERPTKVHLVKSSKGTRGMLPDAAEDKNALIGFGSVKNLV